MTPQPPSQPSNYLDQSSGDYLRSQLQAMQNGVYATMVSPDHTKAWDSDQLVLQRNINDLAGQTKTGVDPERLTGSDEFATLTLEQIRDLAYQIKPGVVQAVSQAWDHIGKKLLDATTALGDGLWKSVGSGWQGQAAGAAAKAFGQLTQTSTDNANSASMVGMKIAFAQRGSDETLRMLGPVLAAAVPSAPLPTLMGSNGKPLTMGTPAIPGTTNIPFLAATQSQASQKEEARQACLQVLNNIYAPGIHGGDQGVPVLPSVQQAANPVGPAGPGVAAPGPAPSSGAGTPGPGTPTPGNQTPGNQTGNQQPGQDQGQQQPTSAQNPDSSHTDTAGYHPSQSSTPGLGTSSSPTSTAGLGSSTGGGGPSSLGGSAVSGLGGLGGGGGVDDGTSRSGGPGASVPGKPVPTSAAAATPGKAGASGTPGMSAGSMGQGANGKGEKDSEHKSSELLHGRHLEEWIDDGQRVLPAFGVIGANPEPSQEQPPSAPPRRGGVSGEYR